MDTYTYATRALVALAATLAAGAALAAPATHYIVTLPDPMVSYANYEIRATAVDDANAPDTTYAGTVALSSSDPGFVNLGPGTFIAGTFVINGILKNAGSQSITLTDVVTPSIAGTASTTVVPGPTSQFTVSGTAPGAGSSFAFTVVARDLFGNLTPDYAGTVHITSSDAQATLPADFAISGGSGTATATLRTAGTQSMTALDSVDDFTGSNNFSVTPAAATHFAVTLPATVDPNAQFHFDVMAYDAFDNANALYDGTIHFTSSDSGATLPSNGTLVDGHGAFNATLQVVNSEAAIIATDTVDSSITGTGNVATTPVELQSFEVD